MEQVVFTNTLRLPDNLARKLNSEQVILREVEDGILLVPVSKKVKPLRGLIKDTGLTLDHFLEQKHADKELDT